MVLLTGNDPVFLHYQCSVMPLYYESNLEQDIGFEPMTFSLATKHSTTELILQSFTYYAARRLLNLSAAYEAAKASGFTNGTTLHVPLM